MLRPSRPMMRPFMSSAGSWTTETVVSAAWPAASRCMTTERMLRTRRSASRFVSSSIARRRLADSWRTWSSSSFISIALAWDAERPDERSSWRTARSRIASISPSRSATLPSRLVSSDARESSDCSRAWRRSSSRPASALRATASSSGLAGAGGGGALARPGAVASPGERFASIPAATTRPAARPKATTTAAITISIAFPLPGAGSLMTWRELSNQSGGRPERAPARAAEFFAGRRPRPPLQVAATCAVGSGAPGALARVGRLIARRCRFRSPSSLMLPTSAQRCRFAAVSKASIGPVCRLGGS